MTRLMGNIELYAILLPNNQVDAGNKPHKHGQGDGGI